MSLIEEKLEQILKDLELIKKQLKIVPDRETVITDFESNVIYYQEFAKDELGLEQPTIDNHKSAIMSFLNHSKGIINKDTVKVYLESNESDSWKTNQLKALRRYIRDFLGLGNWINEFHFLKPKAKIKSIPDAQKIAKFINLLPYKIQLVFLVMYNSGLRINEILSLRLSNIDFESGMINASELHKKKTKSSWISFVTNQTAKLLDNYMLSEEFEDDDIDPKLFSLSSRSVQEAFKKTSEEIGVSITPRLLRTIFAEKCTQAGIQDKYIDAFCGRIPQSVLAKHYTDYSPEALKTQYKKVEPYLSLELNY
ncbi:MAG: site-specific integrase [Thaumarchaeota archaeon]|nr:site-specific integrase [Nitrososphaerota archaeon]